jgi:hypothetical protein
MNFRIPFFVLFLLLGYAPIAHSEDRGRQLFNEVINNAKECAAGKSGSEVLNCYIRATPKKCQQHVIEYFSREEKDEARRAWFFCVASCADAGLWSANLGECSRELK